jgi:hypothetical protein
MNKMFFDQKNIQYIKLMNYSQITHKSYYYEL